MLSPRSREADPKAGSASCSVCFDLSIARMPIERPSILDECSFVTSYTAIQQSAVKGDCKHCVVLSQGFNEIQESWDDGGQELFFTEDSELMIIVRPGHSLRVRITNPDIIVTYEFFTVSADKYGSMPAFGVASMVNNELNMARCLELATAWMKNCDENHPDCKQRGTLVLPRRMLDVGDSPDTVYLREFDDTDEKPPYLSLSHCWGTKRLITTTIETLQERKDGIPDSRLPKTFRDAVAITRGLGFQYIWIDSLCIIQNDAHDWQVESMKMADVYMGSRLNLAATHSSGSAGGCFAARTTLDEASQIDIHVVDFTTCIVPDDDAGDDFEIYVRPALHVAHDQFTRALDYMSSIPEVSPLLDRAWVFQERLLARRSLHFHAEELIWECNTGITCECSRLEDYTFGDSEGNLEYATMDQLKTMYTSLLSSGVSEKMVFDQWLEIVGEYCNLKLTKDFDRLPALSGLVSRIGPHVKSKYIAGLWLDDLPRQLLWQKHHATRPSFRDPAYGAPSWSWASVCVSKSSILSTPHINYDLVSGAKFEIDSRFIIHSVVCEPNTTNPYGTFGEGRLIVAGALAPVTYTLQRVSSIAYDGQVVSIWADCATSTSDLKLGPMQGSEEGEVLYCLLVGRSEKTSRYSPKTELAYGLVLRKGEDGIYTRVGLYDSREGEGLWANAPIVTLTIL